MKKIIEPPNVTKVQLYVMLILSNNVTIEPANVSKKIMKPLNVTKIRLSVMVLPNVMMKLSNVCKKNN